MAHPHTLRADAERNRQAILRAAATVFQRNGTGAPLEEVAREAGVGIATLYRRFPDRESLIEAVFEARMSDYADMCEASARRARTEPWSALSDHVHAVVDAQIADRGFSDALLKPSGASPGFADEHRRAFTATAELVATVVEAGVVRPDFDHFDLYLLTLANSGLQRMARTSRAPAAHRLAALLLEGVRHPAPDPLPAPPRAWRRATRGL